MAKEKKSLSGCFYAMLACCLINLFLFGIWGTKVEDKKKDVPEKQIAKRKQKQKLHPKPSMFTEEWNKMKELIDSIEFVEWEKVWQEKHKKKTGAFIVEGDSIMHTHIHTEIPIDAKIKLVSEYDMTKNYNKMCGECEEDDDIVSRYYSDELIDAEDADLH